MAINKFNTNFKQRDDIMDNITPKAISNMEIAASVGSYKPASWLPVVFTKSDRAVGTDAFVISAYKAVALDSRGFVVPAGLRTALGGNSSTGNISDVVLTYTATDVDYGVFDLVTGARVAAPVTYTKEAVCDALIERGWVGDDAAIAAGATIPVAAMADVNIVIDLFISDVMGIVLQDVYVYGGQPETGDQFFTNYTAQSGVTFLTRAMMVMPLRVAGATTSDGFNFFTLDGGGSTAYVAGAFIDDGEYWDLTNIRQLTRYGAISETAPVVALGLAERPVAKNTSRTPVSCTRSGVLVRERSSVDAISKEGDWFLDDSVGVLFLHSDTWATVVAVGSATTTFSYSFYTDTGLATSARYVHFDGPCRPGAWVTVDAQSNFTIASDAVVSAGKAIGRVTRIKSEPLGLLDSVKTAWNFAGAPASMQMPGSATAGYSDLITLSGERVSDTLVEIKFEV